MRVRHYKVRCPYCYHKQDYSTMCVNCHSYIYVIMECLEEVSDGDEEEFL